jgi:hypothetical protein
LAKLATYEVNMVQQMNEHFMEKPIMQKLIMAKIKMVKNNYG